MICSNCKQELLWGGDDDFEHDYQEGIVSNYSCTNEECDVDSIDIYTVFKK